MDFVGLEFKEDKDDPLPFLCTTKAQFYIYEGIITLHVREETCTLNLYKDYK